MSKEMITKWEDAGRDCQYCGGEIYKRTDIQSSEYLTICYECQECGAQWTFNGALQRDPYHKPGNAPTQVIDSAPEKKKSLEVPQVPTWAWLIIAVAVTYLFIRMGGLAIVRALILPVILVGVGYLIYRIGKDQHWW